MKRRISKKHLKLLLTCIQADADLLLKQLELPEQDRILNLINNRFYTMFTCVGLVRGSSKREKLWKMVNRIYGIPTSKKL